ncbi:hypothetical protein LTR36_006848 [Oleoguttula mirabilis]|uniref:Acyl-CoA dehydrogenase n=1 Tax=Oleoguttula mirabilis TaxID=1507867 RepID=A0AAV9JC96_9PEZI|nr:hypothetical protein LTR36_006848 [Oleoguttula mirabilis]
MCGSRSIVGRLITYGTFYSIEVIEQTVNMVDFNLSPTQQAIRSAARSFAATHLKTARSIYEAAAAKPDARWEDRFRSTKPIYEAAAQAGLIKAQIPQALGGTGGGLIDAAIVVEELYAVETSASLTILGAGLGLLPLIIAGTPDLHERFLKPFLDGQKAPLASLVFSEPAGSANYADVGGSGLGTVAVQEGEEFVISGEKIWATDSGGWDDRGADFSCVCCRVKDSGPDMRSQVAIIIVTRSDIEANEASAFTVLSHPQTVGHTAVNGPHIRYKNLRVPKSNMLAPPGKGADVIDLTFTASAALVGAMGIGVMRQVFEHALAWAKTEKRGGNEVMLKKQSVSDLLIKIKIRCEAARALTWKAACAFDMKPESAAAAELCYAAKILSSESAVESVMDGISLIGVSAYSRAHPLGDLLQDAMVLPIFDGGNVGVRRRQIESIFAMPGYDPWEATFGKASPPSALNGTH